VLAAVLFDAIPQPTSACGCRANRRFMPQKWRFVGSLMRTPQPLVTVTHTLSPNVRLSLLSGQRLHAGLFFYNA
jgi:hypothetical protein